MKTAIIFFLAFAAAGARAAAPAYDLSTLMGTANERMPFVREVVKDYLSFVPGMNARAYTTGTLYFGWRNGVRSVHTIQILDDRGGSSSVTLARAIDAAAKSSAVVLIPVGGGDFGAFCRQMAEKNATVFLLPMIAVGASPECTAGNILTVSGLNAALSDLDSREPYGAALRLAIPVMNLSAPVGEGENYAFTNRSFGMAIAAGKIAQVSRRNPELRGAALVDRFLAEETEVLPALEGKVAGGRALTRFER